MIKLIEVASGDENKRFFERAAQKIIQHWKDGDLPDDACWAS
ncbi:MAG TPA: hypothetical protein VJ810_28930 [Blastocatellia bacterium]|nr:hypothetical protein [Blastocatellia bacterium]